MAKVDGRALRWVGHREQRRAELVQAALEVIEDVGPTATVDQITARLGLTRQALYRQFDDRADLDRAIAERAATRLVDELVPQLALTDDVEASIRRALHGYLDHVEAHLPLYRFVRAHDNDTGTATEGSAVRRVKDTLASRVAGIARDHLVATGAAPVEVAEPLATGLVGMADAVIGRWLDDPRGASRDEVVAGLAVMLRGAVEAVLARAYSD